MALEQGKQHAEQIGYFVVREAEGAAGHRWGVLDFELSRAFSPTDGQLRRCRGLDRRARSARRRLLGLCARNASVLSSAFLTWRSTGSAPP